MGAHLGCPFLGSREPKGATPLSLPPGPKPRNISQGETPGAPPQVGSTSCPGRWDFPFAQIIATLPQKLGGPFVNPGAQTTVTTASFFGETRRTAQGPYSARRGGARPQPAHPSALSGVRELVSFARSEILCLCVSLEIWLPGPRRKGPGCLVYGQTFDLCPPTGFLLDQQIWGSVPRVVLRLLGMRFDIGRPDLGSRKPFSPRHMFPTPGIETKNYLRGQPHWASAFPKPQNVSPHAWRCFGGTVSITIEFLDPPVALWSGCAGPGVCPPDPPLHSTRAKGGGGKETLDIAVSSQGTEVRAYSFFGPAFQHSFPKPHCRLQEIDNCQCSMVFRKCRIEPALDLQFEGKTPHLLQKTPHLLQKTGHNAPHLLQKTGHNAPHLLQKTGHYAPHMLQKTGHNAPHLLQKTGHYAPHLLQKTGHYAPYLLQKTGAAPAPAITTSFPPAIPSSSSNTSCPGGVQLGASVSTALGSASADFRSPAAAAGAEGFKFGSSSSTAFSATGSSRLATSTTETEASGFMFGKSTPDNSQTVASSGFTFGKSTPDNSQTVASSGFTFGKSTPDNSQTVASSGFTFGKSTPDNSQIVASSGFTFGKSTPDSSQTVASSGFTFGKSTPDSSQTVASSGFTFGKSTPDNSQIVASSGFTFGKSTPDSSQTVASSGFTFGKSTPDNSQTVASSGFTFGVQREKKDSAARNDAGEVTSTETSVIDSCTTNTCNRVSLVSGGDRMCHSVSDNAAPSSSGAAHSTSPGCSQFSRTTHSQSSPPFVFGSSVSTEVTLNGSNSCEKQSTGQKTSSTNSGFIFGGTAKAPSTSQNGHHLFAPSSVGSTGFVFGASGGSGFVFGASGGSGFASSRSGESGVVTRPHSGQHGSALFSSPAMSTVNGDNGAKETGTLGEVSAVNGDTGVSDNGTVQGVGPADVTTPPLTSSKPADDGGEPFTFATPTAVTSSAVAFNFGQLSKGRQRSGVAFNTQTNAASSKDTGPLPPLGAESSTNTGHFSFTVGAGSQSNAAAASSLTPGTGFSFSGSVQPSFSFGADKLSNSTASGADKLSNSTASAFQFASPRAADRAAAHTASQSTFGQAALSTSDPPTPLFTAPTTTPNSFSIGAGDGPRRLKRAVRRVPKQ
ncbi:uncharacterized protein LOC143280232 [Babylonia areolata]|uniref:uncharacterized protein LOC143280232 n=1 Tax=Babylonia areolata TaxID=304850 RepID=UPI003FD40254